MTEQAGNNKPNEAEGLAFPLSDNEKLIEDAANERYPDIEANPKTFPTGWSREQERNAFIAGAVFEKALTPTDDEREARETAWQEYLAHMRALDAENTLAGRGLIPSHRDWQAGWNAAHRSVVPERSEARYAEFEDWEQEMFRHQPVLSMADGSIAGCQCLDRVFVKGREDWGTHLASVITARLPEPQGDPSEAQVDAASREIDLRGFHIPPMAVRAALRAAGGVR